MTIFEGSHFTSKQWVEDAWYFFYDLEGDIYQSDPYLLATSDSEFERLNDKLVPV